MDSCYFCVMTGLFILSQWNWVLCKVSAKLGDFVNIARRSPSPETNGTI